MLELSRKIACFFIKLSTIVSVLFLFLVMCVVNFDAVINFIKILILLFTAGFLKQIENKSESVLFFILLVSLLLLPYGKIVFEGFGVMILIDLVGKIFKNYSNEDSIIFKSLFFILIILVSVLLVGYVYPFYDLPFPILIGFIFFMLMANLTLISVVINLLFEIFQSDSRA